MIITKQDSDYLKGIALVLMLIHHLFAFPHSIKDSVEIIGIIQGFNIEYQLGVFGKICVPIFFFLSGYGFSAVGIKDWMYYFIKIAKFFSCFWLVFVIFVPIGLIFYSSSDRYAFEIYNFVGNLFGFISTYNGNWWFIQPYLFLVAALPLINILRERPFLLLMISFILFTLSFIVGRIYGFDTPVISLRDILYWQPIFILGYVVAINKEDKIVFDIMSKIENNVFYFSMLTPIVVFTSFKFFGVALGSMVSTPFFVLLLLQFKKIIGIEIYNIFTKIGVYSMYMWLTHSFYSNYFFQEYIYYPRYTVLIFLTLLVVSYITACILTVIYDALNFSKIFR